MVNSKSLIIIKFLIGIYLFQFLLPLALIFSIQIVKNNQHSRIAKYSESNDLFIKLKMDFNEFSKLVITDNEFILNHELYDLKSIRRGNDKVILTVIKDEDEKKLKLANENVEKRSTKNTFKLLKSCQLIFTYFEKTNKISLMLQSFATKFNLMKLKVPETPYLKVVSPPPDFC